MLSRRNFTALLPGFTPIVAAAVFNHPVDFLYAHVSPCPPGFLEHPLDVLRVAVWRGTVMGWLVNSFDGDRQAAMA